MFKVCFVWLVAPIVSDHPHPPDDVKNFHTNLKNDRAMYVAYIPGQIWSRGFEFMTTLYY